MRLAVTVALLASSFVGCTTTTAPTGPDTPPGDWRVVPLDTKEGSNNPTAILVDQRTGDTWEYFKQYSNMPGRWNRMKRDR